VKDQSKSLQDLIGCGVKRVLTSGGHPTAVLGADQLSKLVSEGGDRIVVIAGGGITDENAVAVVESTGVGEVHGTFRKRIETGMKYLHPRVSFSSSSDSSLGIVVEGDTNNDDDVVNSDDWMRYVTDGDMIERIKRQLEENMR
jgi:copper homeostasis protein CutC